MQAIAIMIAEGTNKGRFADPWQRGVPDDRDALPLRAIVQQNSGPLCRELAAAPPGSSRRKSEAAGGSRRIEVIEAIEAIA
jgi:hypothetical protein